MALLKELANDKKEKISGERIVIIDQQINVCSEIILALAKDPDYIDKLNIESYQLMLDDIKNHFKPMLNE